MTQNNENREKIHSRAIRGINLFNQKKFFEAHEELEFAWREEEGSVRDLYRGILQVGVAYYHIQRRNFSGGRKLLLRSKKWLNRFPNEYLGINVKQLQSDSDQILKLVEDGYFDHATKIDKEIFSTIKFIR